MDSIDIQLSDFNISEPDLKEKGPVLLNAQRPSVTSIPPHVSSTVLNQEHEMEFAQQNNVKTSTRANDKVRHTLAPEPGESGKEFFLRVGPCLTMGKLRDFLGAPDPPESSFWADFRDTLFETFPLEGKTIMKALRLLSSKVLLPLEGQQISRILESFAKIYTQKNPTVFASYSDCHTLLLTIFLLNTKPEQMRVYETFIQCYRGIDTKRQMNELFIKSIHKDVIKSPVKGFDKAADANFDYFNNLVEVIEDEKHRSDEVVTALKLTAPTPFVDERNISMNYPAYFYICQHQPSYWESSTVRKDLLHLRTFAQSKSNYLLSCDEVVVRNTIDPESIRQIKKLSPIEVMGQLTTFFKTAVMRRRSYFLSKSNEDLRSRGMKSTTSDPHLRATIRQNMFTINRLPAYSFQINSDSATSLSILFTPTSFLSPQFLLPFMLYSFNKASFKLVVSMNDQEISVSTRIPKTDHKMSELVNVKSPVEFLNNWMDEAEDRASTSHLIMCGPMIKKNIAFTEKLSKKSWSGAYYLLVLPGSSSKTSTPNLPELWELNDNEVVKLEQAIQNHHITKDHEFCNFLEKDIGSPKGDSDLNLPSLRDEKKLFENPLQFISKPRERISVENTIAFVDETHTKYSDVFSFSQPHIFPAPMSPNSHSPFSGTTKDTRNIFHMMAFLNRESYKQSDKDDTIFGDKDFIKMMMRSVGVEQVIKTNGITVEPCTAAHQWKVHLNIASTVTTVIQDLRNIVQSPKVSDSWTGLVQMIEDYFRNSLDQIKQRNNILLIPSSLYWLDEAFLKLKADEHGKLSIKEFVSDLKEVREGFFNALKIILNREFIDFIDLVQSIDPESENDVIIRQLKYAKVLISWLKLMYITRKEKMKQKIHDCTRNINQLEYAISENLNVEDSKPNLSHVVLDIGSAHRRGFLASRNIANADMEEDTEAVPAVKMVKTVDSLSVAIADDLKYFEKEIEWIRIEYHRWDIYTTLLNEVEKNLKQMIIEYSSNK